MIYETFNLSTKNPIISNHSAYGQELLPGLAYIDLIFQFFKKHYYSYNEFELRNLSIYNPLIVGKDYDVLLTLQCSEIREGQWHIVVEGQERRNDGTVVLNKKRYVTAEMHKIGSVIFDETLDLNQIEHLAKSVGSLDEVYEQCRLQDLVHTGLMKAEGKIYEGETATFIDISLGQEARPGAESFLFHPALIDGSAIGAGTLLSSLVKGEERLFLPLFYESFRASELIQQRCLTRIQTSALARKKELLYMTVEFFNESGKKVAELKNFISKLVRGAELINPNLKSTFEMEATNFGRSLLNSFQEPSNTENDLNPVTTAETEFFLQQLIADRLKKPVEQIETQVGYYEMGLNSPGLLEIVQEIETKIGAALSPTLLFEYTTIAELSAYLTENYPSKFSQYSAVTREVGQEMLGNATAQAPSTDSEVGNGVLSNDNTEEGRAATMPAIEQDIAIIGMAGRYPKAINLQEFWNNLKTGKDCISEIPKSRWDWKLYEGVKSPSGKNISKWGGFIDDPDCFDPQFFRVTPREAELMDPQERLFLENCWEAIEDAGYTPKTLVMPQGPNKRHHVGVFVGVMHKDYTQIGAEAALHGQVVPLSLNYASIANRVSYFCNFHGPSMAVDTVCSSSLTAVHLALESIRHGECEVALAGGVNLSLHPNKYLTYGLMDMHSSDGYCHTFGKEGDGFVSGEGVGTVLLKPLHKAVQDGDHIYSVIKGSTINHVGTVSGMTVPSPISQADMITACIKKAKVHPRTISYVEAQGTGTSLGDPIEIEGLAKAFRLYTQDLQYCSIGSVKSNIGHAESAGGIGALTKVALQLYYKTLVPSLHSEELNSHIDFKQSPFFVQHETEEWKKPVLVEEGRQVSYPRRAGLNSYGATGSNAHVILEEYIPKQKRQQIPAMLSKNDRPTIIPLSAKDKERLHAYAKKLLEFLKKFPSDKNLYHGEINISELAYTLQVGRESMEYRVVFLVKDIAQLIEKLEAYGEGKEVINNCWRGDGKHSKETIDLLNDQESLDLINKWMINGKTQKIAELWVKGFAIDWNLFYRDAKPCRISLPTYPFARERYWVAENRSGSDGSNITRGSCVVNLIHPLLHQNTSNFSEQRFSSIFTGQEFFLSDHVVLGQRVLPGVAYLEMARVAIVQSSEDPAHCQDAIRLKNIVWTRPIAVGEQPVKVHIGLFPEDSGEIAFEIYSQSEEAGAKPVVHSQGSALLISVLKAPTLDLPALQAQCSQSTLSSSQCYEAFRAIGIDYGPAHQGIEMVYVGSGQVLAKLSLPLSVSDTQDQFVLHPSLMDSALQASIGLLMSGGDTMPVSTTHLKPARPFALHEIEIIGNCTSAMWALIRYADGGKAGDKVQKFDIDLYDIQGNVCVRIKGLSSRTLEGDVKLPRATLLKQQNGTEALKTLDTQEEIKAVPAIEQDGVQEKAANYFKELLASVCKLPVYRIEADVQLEQYGVDSIMGMQMIKKLEKLFGSLPKTLIFEYKTIKDLTGYFLENYRDRLTELWGIEDKAAVAAEDYQDSKNWTEPEKLAFGTRRRPLRFASLRMEPQDKKASMDIAIIGVSGRYPQAGNIQEFWNNLQGGTDCITEIPKERWDHSLYFDEDKSKLGKTSCKWGGFIEDVDQFDPLFFNISAQEAEIMDPMTRLFLETVWNLFENSGYTRETLECEYQSRVGVYVGAMYQQYHWFHSDIIRESAISLSSYSYLANKISHYFNLQGPSIAIDTMCSSSAVAIHMACESLIKGDCQMAIAGGVNLSIHPKKYLALSPTQLLGSQINSRSFGDGDGYLPAEGVGAVLLKPLTNAIRDRDLVLAVIKSTATNHGGASAYGVPSPDIQARLIEENFIKAEINPRTISYVEAFAVGSPLGDPIEVTALNKAFQKFTTDQQFCAIGSVKSNIGHAEAASGISQLTKVVLQLQNKKLVPSIKADPLNPNINFENTPFYLQRELQEWKRPVVKIDGEEREYPRRATVSSFGGGGSNVHLIVEEYISGQEKTVHTSAATSPQIVVFSAKKRDQLQVVVEQMLEFIKLQKELFLPDFAYTLQVGREAMEYRLAMVVNNREELIQGLKESLESFEEGKETEKFIPSFTGNLEVDLLNIKRLFSGNLGETMVKMLVEEKNLEKIALYWAQGGKIPWKSLHEGQEVRKISLPTYPFKKQRCWIESQPEL
ncbi:MAG: pksN 10 [Firmicutes bacterium]|nr:pksN 10 [Bacillota bacterium]